MKTQNTILSAAAVLGIASGINAVLGFVKGRILASYFGVSTDLAIFYTADRIPNLIYSLLVLGAISTVFIPVFSQEYKKDPKSAWKTASSMITASTLFFLFIGSLAFIFAEPIIRLLSVGRFDAAGVSLGANLMRIMLLSQLLLVVSSFFTCILQTFKYFTIPAISPVLYSLGMILGTVLFTRQVGIYAPAYGVAIGSLFHLLIQLPILKHTDFKFNLTLNLKDKGIREIFSLMPPRIISVLISNVISTVNNSLAILVSAASVVHLKFASQLEFFPVNLFGVSLAAAILPTLSSQADEENLDSFKKTFLTTFHQMMFLVIPISVILLVLRIPVVRLVYGVSNFPWEATVKTSYALAFFSFSIFAQSAVYLITRAFYALKDTKTPVTISSVTLVINVMLSLLFVKVLGFGVWSIALTFSITSILDLIIMMSVLSKKVGGFKTEAIIKPFTKIGFAAMFMGFGLYMPLKLLDQFVFDTTHTINLIALTAVAGTFGIAVYLYLTHLFKVEEIEIFYKLLRKLKLVKSPYVPATD